MKKAILATAMASALMGSASVALADGYVGLDYQGYTYSASGVGDLKPSAMGVRLGSSLGQYAKVEARLGTGVQDDFNKDNTNLYITNLAGFYVKGGMDVMNIVFPYAIVGVSKYDMTSDEKTSYVTEDSVSYGVGADVHYKHFQVGIEWMQVEHSAKYNLDALTVSYAYIF